MLSENGITIQNTSINDITCKKANTKTARIRATLHSQITILLTP